MQVNWFSPLPPTKSGVATHFTGPLVPCLSRYCDLTLWSDQEFWDPVLEQHARLRSYSADDLRPGDFEPDAVNVYHIGNNAEFHESIYTVALRFPGVVVLHDPNLFLFFAGLSRGEPGQIEDFCDRIELAHGQLGRLAGEALFSSFFKTSELLGRFPMTTVALTSAFGVVTHSRQAFKELSALKRWPVQYLPLGYPQHPVQASPARRNGPGIRLIIFGDITRYRRVGEVLKAIGTYPRRELLTLDIFGEVWPDNDFARISSRYGITDRVRVHGYVAEEDLDRALDEADLAINLRFPTMGEASGSQLRIWQHALPSLNTPVGWYAEQPEATMEFVRPGFEQVDLHAHFDRFLADPEHYRKKGNAGRTTYMESHSPDTYARRIVEFCQSATRFRSHATVARLLCDVLPQLRQLK